MKTAGHIFLGLWLLGAILSAAGCTTHVFDAVELNQQAQVYYQHNQYDSAVELLQQSLDADFENPASHYWLGRCYEAKGELLRAADEYGLAVRFAPAIETAQMAYISTLYRSQQTQQARDAAQSFLEHKEASAGEFLRLAQSFADQNMEEQVVLACHAATRAEPQNPRGDLFLVDYYFAKDNKELALQYLVKAFHADPLYPGLAKRLGDHGLRTDIPQPTFFPEPPTALEKDIRELH